ncbi:MAG: cell division protein FtsH, partial [Bdellovibrionota bacterium]
MKSTQKVMAFWFFLFILAIFLFQAYQTKNQKVIHDFDFNKFMVAVENKEIIPDKVTIKQDTGEFIGEIKPEFEKKYGGTQFSFIGNTGDSVYKDLRDAGITPR